jgi:hypothetical protein
MREDQWMAQSEVTKIEHKRGKPLRKLYTDAGTREITLAQFEKKNMLATTVDGFGDYGFSPKDVQSINRGNALRLFPHLNK